MAKAEASEEWFIERKTSLRGGEIEWVEIQGREFAHAKLVEWTTDPKTVWIMLENRTKTKALRKGCDSLVKAGKGTVRA